MAKVLAECELESRSSAVLHLTNYGTTSPVSRDAYRLFRSSGSYVEAEVYRQFVVERTNDGDITTALKLCCIGHQIPICRDNLYRNLPISDPQTLRDTFEQILSNDSNEPERSKFLLICDEWYRVLGPQRLMNIELLREWISTRQYANTEDPVVSMVVTKCSVSKIEEEIRKRGKR